MDANVVKTFLQDLKPWRGKCTFDDVIWGDRINKTSNTKDDQLVVYRATVGGQDVVIKMMVYNDNPDGQAPVDVKAFFLEKKLYMQVINNIIISGQCGNLVPAISTRKCDLIPDTVPFFNDPIIDPNQTKKISALITMVPPFYAGRTVAEFISENPRLANSANIMKRIMFQMLYTLEACHQNDIIHNDNHLNNWLVGAAANPNLALRYTVDKDHTYSMTGNLCVYLFDWDRGFSSDLNENELLDDEGKDKKFMTLCESVGACNKYRPYRDIFQALCSMSDMLKALCKTNTPLGGVLHTLMRNVEMIQMTKCSSASVNSSQSRVCHLLPTRLDKDLGESMPSALTLLTDPFFDDLLAGPTSSAEYATSFILPSATVILTPDVFENQVDDTLPVVMEEVTMDELPDFLDSFPVELPANHGMSAAEPALFSSPSSVDFSFGAPSISFDPNSLPSDEDSLPIEFV